MDIYFWAIAIALGIPLWWFAFVATKRMRIGKNLEREEQARRNLERHARAQEEKARQAEQNGTETDAQPVSDTASKSEQSSCQH